MTPSYLNPPSSPFPQPVEKEANDQVFDHHHHLLFTTTTTTTTTTTSSPTSQASSSSLTFPIFFNPTQDQGGINYDHIDQEQDQQELNKYLFHGGSSSSDHHQFLPIPCHDPTSSVLLPTAESTDHHHEVNNNNYGGLQFSIMNCKQEEMIIKAESCQIENGSSSSSVKWMSSKMRLMRKMMNPDRPRIIVESSTTQKFQQDQHQPISPNSNNNCTIRVCSDCNTTKTPLWRSGPRGPKSLCNACGIRQRKARRAMAAAAAAAAANGTILASSTAAAAANGTILASSTTDHTSSSSIRTTTTTTDNKGQQQYKKRCKITAPRSKKKICFEDLTINLSKNSDFQRVFPQDEKEAAILLMALSCGLVHG